MLFKNCLKSVKARGKSLKPKPFAPVTNSLFGIVACILFCSLFYLVFPTVNIKKPFLSNTFLICRVLGQNV